MPLALPKVYRQTACLLHKTGHYYPTSPIHNATFQACKRICMHFESTSTHCLQTRKPKLNVQSPCRGPPATCKTRSYSGTRSSCSVLRCFPLMSVICMPPKQKMKQPQITLSSEAYHRTKTANSTKSAHSLARILQSSLNFSSRVLLPLPREPPTPRSINSRRTLGSVKPIGTSTQCARLSGL